MPGMTPKDWLAFLDTMDEIIPRAPKPPPAVPPYIDQDLPPPSPEETARRLERDRALQRWHITTNPELRSPTDLTLADLHAHHPAYAISRSSNQRLRKQGPEH